MDGELGVLEAHEYGQTKRPVEAMKIIGWLIDMDTCARKLGEGAYRIDKWGLTMRRSKQSTKAIFNAKGLAEVSDDKRSVEIGEQPKRQR